MEQQQHSLVCGMLQYEFTYVFSISATCSCKAFHASVDAIDASNALSICTQPLTNAQHVGHVVFHRRLVDSTYEH